MEQVPELPKDWSHWVDKVAIQQNYIYYHYKKGGAKTGYCTSVSYTHLDVYKRQEL